MKPKILFVFFVFCTVQYGFSQIFTGGNLSYQYSNNEIGNTSTNSDIITIAPLLGYRFEKADVGIMFQFQKYASSSDEEIGLGASIFGSNNLFTINKFSIFGRVSFQYINIKIKGDKEYSISTPPYSIEYTIEQNLNTVGISIAPIFEYKLLNRFTLYTSIGSIYFNHLWGKNKISSSNVVMNNENITGNNLGISVSSAISLGFYFFF